MHQNRTIGQPNSWDGRWELFLGLILLGLDPAYFTMVQLIKNQGAASRKLEINQAERHDLTNERNWMRSFSSRLLIGILLGSAVLLNAIATKTTEHYVDEVDSDWKVELGWPVAFVTFWIESRMPPIFSLTPVEPELRPRFTPFELVLWEFGNDEYVDTINYGLAISLGKLLVIVVWWGTACWCLASCFQLGGIQFGLRQVILIQALAGSAFFLMIFT